MEDTELWSPAIAEDNLTENTAYASDITGFKVRHAKISEGKVIEVTVK